MSNPWAEIPDGSPPEPAGPYAPVTLEAVRHIAHRLRAPSAAEIFNRLPHDDPDLLAMEVVATIEDKGRGRIVLHKGQPAAWVAFIEEREGLWYSTMAGTDDLSKVAIPCIRWARWSAYRTRHSGQKLYCLSRVTECKRAPEFLRACGGKPDGEPQVLGKDGSLYQRYVWE